MLMKSSGICPVALLSSPTTLLPNSSKEVGGGLYTTPLEFLGVSYKLLFPAIRGVDVTTARTNEELTMRDMYSQQLPICSIFHQCYNLGKTNIVILHFPVNMPDNII